MNILAMACCTHHSPIPGIVGTKVRALLFYFKFATSQGAGVAPGAELFTMSNTQMFPDTCSQVVEKGIRTKLFKKRIHSQEAI